MPSRPEILAPAGDHASLTAALASGADAVYFGLDDGFNARARAVNFATDDLADIVAAVHRAGARAYVTLNTLVFEAELPVLEGLLRKIAASGVDALIVQDPAVCLLARAVCPQLELHASTQMTVSSPEAARFAKGLGVSRVVVPRELSTDEIAAFARGTDVELEVFVHGALCMSWSGQCLTSEAWGGRSANRGQCAQSCRLPYGLDVDGARRDLGDVKYLLSPRDLAGHRAVPALAEAGVASLKIEGRLKGPAYVHTAVSGLRRWVDAVAAGPDATAGAEGALATDLAEMHRVYSRGFSDGFLMGTDHQSLVDGRHPKHRGAMLGRVVAVAGRAVTVRRADEFRILGQPPEAALAPARGMGVVFDLGDPEAADEPGGPLFDVAPTGDGFRLVFGDPGPDLRRVPVGARVWVTGDPAPEARAQKLVTGAPPRGRVPATLVVAGEAGEPLRATLEAGGQAASGATASALTAADGAGLDAALLESKLGALGGTPFALAGLDATALAPGLFVPSSELKALRRELAAALDAQVAAGPARALAADPALPGLLASLPAPAPRDGDAPRLVPLCRLDAQLDAVIAAGLPEVELDWMEMVGLGRAVARAREAGLRVTIATTRVQKPGEEGYDRRIAKLAPDAVLVRHWGGVMAFAQGQGEGGLPRPARVHGDFSLNVTNSVTARHLLGLGLDTLTASHDLDEAQLMGLLAGVPRGRVAVTLHHHIPTFHTEHCVYAHLLSDGRDFKSCGRPCEAHRVSLVDPKGLAHPVIVDVGCRNTVFEARAQSAAALVPRLVDAGVARFRVELVRETAAETAVVLGAYAALLRGELTSREAVAKVGVHEQFGVVRGVAATRAVG
ncbi:MAG: U32 family peptidase [Deltaproteobacteria bacterium]|nr:U32 family peptidase [Deltaproteobacteria bacterium]